MKGHWKHTLACIALCTLLHFALELWSYDDTSRYIADLQMQIDNLKARVSALEPLP